MMGELADIELSTGEWQESDPPNVEVRSDSCTPSTYSQLAPNWKKAKNSGDEIKIFLGLLRDLPMQ